MRTSALAPPGALLLPGLTATGPAKALAPAPSPERGTVQSAHRVQVVEGFRGTPTLDAIDGVVLHSDVERSGSFESSNPMLDQLQHSNVWGQTGNLVDVPTDCPQHDERLGWRGDAQVFSRTAVR